MRNSPFRCRPKNWEQRRPYPFPTGCSFVWQRSDSACQWTSRDRTGLGWLLPLDFGVVPCSKCHSRDFIGQYRKRPVYHLNRSLGGRRLVRLPGMAASNVCERVLSTHQRHSLPEARRPKAVGRIKSLRRRRLPAALRTSVRILNRRSFKGQAERHVLATLDGGVRAMTIL